MRWYEIIGLKETPDTFRGSIYEADMHKQAKQALLDVIAPLKSQRINSITVRQALDTLKSLPQFQGIQLDDRFVMDAAKGLKAVTKIQADPEAGGAMTMYLDTPVGDREVDPKTAEREKQDISRAAMRTVTKKNRS